MYFIYKTFHDQFSKIVKYRLSPLYFIILFVAFYLLPIFLNQKLLLGRSNDLTEFFLPLLQYTKNNLLNFHLLPLWNTMYLSGTPLLGNPQSPYFYLPNIIFLILPIEAGFIISIFGHLVFAGSGFYLLSRKIFKFDLKISLICSILFLSSPKMSGLIELGHFGLIIATSWLPWLLLSGIKAIRTLKTSWIIFFAICLSSVFFSHTVTFLLSSIVIFAIQITVLIRTYRARFLGHANLFVLEIFIIFGLIAISLLPQLSYLPHTTRFLLLQDRDVFPKWNSKVESLRISFLPFSYAIRDLQSMDPEKWIPLGSSVLILGTLGLFSLTKTYQVFFLVVISFVFLIITNNTSPIYSFLVKQDFYVLSRVSTRIWFVMIFTSIYLTGVYLSSRKIIPKLLYVLVFLAILESISLSWIKMSRYVYVKKFASDKIIQVIKKDHDIFRVFCTTRCISQKTAADLNLELMDGYDTVQQTNFYKHAWQLTQSYWNHYTLSIPPEETIKFEHIQPKASFLGEYNVKYILSPYDLSDTNLKKVTEVDGITLYLNNLFLSRAYYKSDSEPNTKPVINYYSPNKILINVENNKPLIIANPYNKDWHAYVNGRLETPILETPNALQHINIPESTKFIEVRFEPSTFKIGTLITSATLIALFIFKKSLLKL